jgi:hypothetical protein
VTRSVDSFRDDVTRSADSSHSHGGVTLPARRYDDSNHQESGSSADGDSDHELQYSLDSGDRGTAASRHSSDGIDATQSSKLKQHHHAPGDRVTTASRTPSSAEEETDASQALKRKQHHTTSSSAENAKDADETRGTDDPPPPLRKEAAMRSYVHANSAGSTDPTREVFV